jgi:DNA polymerase-3 subunit delta
LEATWSRGAAKTLFTPLRKLYCFYGEDDKHKDDAVAVLRASVVDESFADFDYEVVEADSRSPDDILASAGLAPFGSRARLLVVRGAEIYRKRDKSGDAERLAAGLAKLGDASCVVLRVAASEDEKSRGKTILTSRLDTAIKEHGVAVLCRALSDDDLVDWVVDEAASVGKKLAADAARRIVAAGQNSRTAIKNELEKTLCFAGDSQIVTLAMADATCSYDPEDVMFKLVDAISRRNADQSLRLLRELLRYDTKPQSVAGRLLALLSRQMRLISQAIELADMHIDPSTLKNLPPDIASELPGEGSIVAMAWKARDIYGVARSWSRAEIVQAFEWMLECDLSNKGGGEGSENVITNIEILILNLCTANRKKAARTTA